MIQRLSFQDEIASLSQNPNAPLKSKLQKMNPFLDKDGLLRIGERLKHSVLPFSQRHRIILPKSDVTDADDCSDSSQITSTFSRTEGAGPFPPPRETVEPSAESSDALVSPFERAEVLRRLRRMKNSSPGPDGVIYEDLKRADPDAAVLTALYNAMFPPGAYSSRMEAESDRAFVQERLSRRSE
ncbi:unnamed protein product [Heterotrigona itama]|uniref:Uncharacterized protein n=1 Tax=Heterotrigona itama TaxID=395501 RepID=A0A6V7HAH6_9HYME|nr:unnamed protein product [Heterotrigona itama]